MIVGIDLGTTNSLIGIWRDGRPVLVPNSLGEFLTPSAVGIADDGGILVGRAAQERLSTHPLLTATAFKRHMGSARETTLGSLTMRPEELSAMVLRSLKADAEAFLGHPVNEAVITVPAYFNDAQRKATKAAGELAGLRVNRLLTEPTAAALAYGLEEPESDRMILVVDIGGGTFDVSLLHIFEGITEVRATAGDTWLGGEDFADVIAQEFRRATGEEGSSITAKATLRRQAELAKRRLTEAESATMSLSDRGRIITHEITRERFETIAEGLLARVRFPIERALRDARVDPGRIERVILAGGASRMPMFRKLITRIFRRLPLQTINPEEVVAQGACVRTGMLMRDTDLIERVMTDVAPFTLGTSIRRTVDGVPVDNVFAPIIERNTVIPASRVKLFVTSEDNQTEVGVDVYQGESRFVDDNIRLGGLVVRVPPGPKGSQAIAVRFTYDPSGLLEVETTAVSTGVKSSLIIEGNPGVLGAEEIAARLAALERLKLHPREEAENQTLLARGKRLYEERLGRERDDIGDSVVAFLGALEEQDPERIRLAAAALRTVLARYESDGLL